MAVSKAQQKAVNKYVKEKYDRINITMPKGKKETIKAYAATLGESVNTYINGAIDERMERECPQWQEVLHYGKSKHKSAE